MNHSSEDNAPLMFLGGIIFIIILFCIMMQFLEKLFYQIKLTFISFGSMAESFFDMALAWGKIIGIAAIAIGLVVAAIYFTYRYVLLVFRGTEIAELHDRNSKELRFDMGDEVKRIEREFDSKIKILMAKLSFLDEKLEEALTPEEKPPEVKLLPSGKSELQDDDTELEATTSEIARSEDRENSNKSQEEACDSHSTEENQINTSSTLNPY